MSAASSSSTPGPSGLTEADVARIVANALRDYKLTEANNNGDEHHSRDDKDGKQYWKTSDVGYFWPDMPIHYGAGRVINFDGARYFRDINAFVAQVKDSVAYYTSDIVRNNLQNCLKGQAFIWYSDICSA
jgi:hypothetical protein